MSEKNQDVLKTQATRFQTIAEYNKLISRANASDIVKELLVKVDQWLALQTPGTEEYNTALIMKACALRRITTLIEVIKIAEPYRETSKGFSVYSQSLIQLETCYRTTFKFDNSIETLRKVEIKQIGGK